MPFRPTPGFEPMTGAEQHSMQPFETDYKGASSYSNLVPRDSDYQEAPLKYLTRRRHSFKHQVWFIASLSIGLLWLGPILYLLIVNFRGSTIGAAAWCVDKQCNVISYQYGTNTTTAALSAKYDDDNHNLMGALQFVAKALEVWWIYIATSMVWLVTVLLARRPDGLPIGYLLTHMEFGDLRALLDPVLYRSVGGRRGSGNGLRRHNTHLYVFIVVAILMCLLANLIGPSVAVLVIPTLFWQNNPQTPAGQFSQLMSAAAPSGDNAIPGCTAADFASGNYICTNITYGASLDALVKTATDQVTQNYWTPAMPNELTTYQTQNNAVSLEQAIPFSFNITASTNLNQSSDTIWSFSRQTLRELSNDFEGLYEVVLGTTTNETLLNQYAPYNSSLQLVLQRQGPVIGIPFYTPATTEAYTTTVANDKQIRCYQAFSETGKTKCLRYGTGWNSSDAVNSFTIDKAQAINDTVNVMVYWSDKAAYIDNGDPCFPNGTLPSSANCDYESKFAGVAPLDVDDQTQDIFVMEFTLPTTNDPNFAQMVEFFPFFGFATYSIDVTNIYPSLTPAEVREPPDSNNRQPVVINPAWMLSAWGVNQGGDANPYGDTAFILQNAVISILQQTDDIIEDNRFFWAIFYSMAQATSMVPHTTTPAASLDDTSDPVNHPVLWNNVYSKVWGWGIDSRTSKLGVVVSILGCIVVVARSVLLVITRAKERSSLKLLATALEHHHQGELSNANEEIELARVRYQMLEDEDDEKLRLMPVP